MSSLSSGTSMAPILSVCLQKISFHCIKFWASFKKRHSSGFFLDPWSEKNSKVETTGKKFWIFDAFLKCVVKALKFIWRCVSERESARKREWVRERVSEWESESDSVGVCVRERGRDEFVSENLTSFENFCWQRNGAFPERGLKFAEVFIYSFFSWCRLTLNHLFKSWNRGCSLRGRISVYGSKCRTSKNHSKKMVL